VTSIKGVGYGSRKESARQDDYTEVESTFPLLFPERQWQSVFNQDENVLRGSAQACGESVSTAIRRGESGVEAQEGASLHNEEFKFNE